MGGWGDGGGGWEDGRWGMGGWGRGGGSTHHFIPALTSSWKDGGGANTGLVFTKPFKVPFLLTFIFKLPY